MKRLMFILFAVFLIVTVQNVSYADNFSDDVYLLSDTIEPLDIEPDCTCNGIPLHGKVKIVSSFPDFKVKVVESFPDLKVKIVNSFPDDCGEWQFVESFPDFTIKFVESFPDFEIKFVESFPGLP